jgi:hypothetical protein
MISCSLTFKFDSENWLEDISAAQFSFWMKVNANIACSVSTPSGLISATINFRIRNMEQRFTHFDWSTLSPPVSCGSLTLLLKIDGFAIDASHAWLGFDNTNYWIKA